jgi:hypothetical protein
VHDLTIAEHVVTVTGKAFYDIAHAPADQKEWEIIADQSPRRRMELGLGFSSGWLKGERFGLWTRTATESASSMLTVSLALALCYKALLVHKAVLGHKARLAPGFPRATR